MEQKSFRLRFPYRPLHWVKELDAPKVFSVGGYKYSIRSEKPYLILEVQPFSTKEEALAFIPELWGSLGLVSVELRTGFLAETKPDSVTYAPDPGTAGKNLGKVQGLIDGHSPAVIPIGENIRAISVGEIKVIITFSAEPYIAALLKALNHSGNSKYYRDSKMKTVIELLSDIERENSIRSKFLTCVIALEVLAQRVMKHKVVQSLLDELDGKVNTQKSLYSKDSDEYHALESIQRELIFRREASLRSSIRNLILEGLPDLNEDERYSRARKLVWAYDLRGSLVHDGVVEESALHQAFDIVYNALLDILRRKMGLNT